MFVLYNIIFWYLWLKFLNFCCKVCPMRWNLAGIVATNKSAVTEHENWTVPIITPLQTNPPPQFLRSACSLSECNCHYLAVLIPRKSPFLVFWHSSSNLKVFTMSFTSTMHWCQLHDIESWLHESVANVVASASTFMNTTLPAQILTFISILCS